MILRPKGSSEYHLRETLQFFDFHIWPKLPGEATYENLLDHSENLVRAFIDTMGLFQDRLGAVVVQLSPKFTAESFPSSLSEYSSTALGYGMVRVS